MADGGNQTKGVEQVPRLALRPVQAAQALGIGRRKLAEITADETSGIPHFKLGTAVLYPVRELNAWVSEQLKAGGTQ